MSIMHFSSVLAASTPAPSGGAPNLLATNTGTNTTATTTPSFSINYGAESGSNRILLALYTVDNVSTSASSSISFNGTAGTIISYAAGDGGRAASGWAVFWNESQISGWSSGSKTFSATLTGAGDNHSVTMQLWENIDQDIFSGTEGRPLGGASDGDGFQQSISIGSLPATLTLLAANGASTTATIVDTADYGIALLAAAAETSGTYATGDISDAGSNITWTSELNAANNPGHAHRMGWDIVPDTSETYNVSFDYGAATTLDSILRGVVVLPPLKNATAALDTTVNSAISVIYTSTATSETRHGVNTNTYEYDGHGFDAGNDYFSASSFGSIANGTYTDAASTSRTISACYWNENDQSLWLAIDTTSVPNNDQTWMAIEIDGQFFSRAGSAYTASINGCSTWAIYYITSSPFAGSNPDTFRIWCRDA